MSLFSSMSKVQRANEALARAGGGCCWACGGTGDALCTTHERQVREAARTEGRRPLTREELGGRGW